MKTAKIQFMALSLTLTAWLIATPMLGTLHAQRAPRTPVPVTDEKIDEAIKKGCEYLISHQRPDGTWPPYQGFGAANTIMSMLALSYAEYPIRSEPMKKGVKALLDTPLTGGNISYQVAFRMQACAKLLRQVDRETAQLVHQRLRADLKLLEDGQTAVGGWSYDLTGGAGLGDFSNVQIVMMGIGEAIRAGLEPRRDVLEKTMMLYIDKQMADGGWNYGRQVHNEWPWTTDQAVPSYGSMTAAGVASLYICRDYLFANMGCPCSSGRSTYRANKVDEAINKALDWLGKNFAADVNPKSTHWHSYWLYSCERVGLATGIKYFGQHNWYHEGAGLILAGQQPDGSWGHRFTAANGEYPQGSLTSIPDTTYQMLFLIKGRAPILMNKLRFDGSWNLHPTDLAKLARYVGNAKEQEFLWQIGRAHV